MVIGVTGEARETGPNHPKETMFTGSYFQSKEISPSFHISLIFFFQDEAIFEGVLESFNGRHNS